MDGKQRKKGKERPRGIISETDSDDSGDKENQLPMKRKSDVDQNKGIAAPPSKKLRLANLNSQDLDVRTCRTSSLDMFDEDEELLISQTSALTISQESAGLGYIRESPSFHNNSESEVSENISLVTSLTSTTPRNSSALSVGSDGPSIDSENAEAPQKTRRKIARPDEWKRNKERIARNRGLAYDSATGQHIPKRRILSPCTCRMRCGERIHQPQREKIFDGYWKLADINRQRELIGKLLKIKTSKRRRTKAGQSRRKYSIKYRFLVDDVYIRTCKVFFLNTLGIKERIIRTVLEKSLRSATGALSQDNRGRHTPAHKLTEQDIAGMKQHILTLPKVPAHWCRRDSTKIYLEGNLSKESTYKLYLSYALEHGLRKVSRPTYIAQLESLNIGFHQPRKDQCWCAQFHNYTEEEQAAKRDQYDIHIRRKEAAREEKNRDTNAALQDPKVMTASFDFEAILYSPFNPTKQLFYKRKLATFNFTVFVVKKKQGHCYMWPEHHGRKGSQEVATCLSKFIDEEVPSGVEQLNLYADNCAGQNKNSIVTAMLGDAIQAHPSLKKINLKFLEAGHTYMECDTMHSTIERNSRNQTVHVPSDWAKIARHAKKTGHPYTVHQFDYREFGNFKAVKEKLFSPHLRYTDGMKVKWSSAKCIQLRRDRSRSVFVRNEHWEPFREFILQKPFKQRTPEKLYEGPLPIPGAKYKDLKSLCQSLVIPKRHHRFYTTLPFDDNDEGDLLDGRGQVP